VLYMESSTKHISIEDYTYSLPEERIAPFPEKDRSSSKLLFYKNGKIETSIFKNINQFLPAKSTLVFNATRVVYARLLFQENETSKPIEVFILEPADRRTIEIAMKDKKSSTWLCMVENARKFKKDILEKEIQIDSEKIILKVYKPIFREGLFEVRFDWGTEHTFSEIIHAIGNIPIPPYFKRKVTKEDSVTYQTVYAERDGSVAAPTAGLHFTKELLDELKQKDVEFENLVLHIGAGTFKPVKSKTIAEHVMHTEEIHVTKKTIENLITKKDHLIAVGTTSLRTLESLFWLGLKIHENKLEATLIPILNQWDAYELIVPKTFTYEKGLEAILRYLERNSENIFTAKTQLLIAPGYQIRSVKGLITNFHQPNSTLLLLVATFIGEDWRKVYEYALENKFRFLSYGDSSLLLKV